MVTPSHGKHLVQSQKKQKKKGGGKGCFTVIAKWKKQYGRNRDRMNWS